MSVPPSYPSFFWSNEVGRNSKTERWEQGESNDATALWAPTHTPCRAPITLPLINRANPSKCGACGQMCVWTDLQTHTHTFTAGIADRHRSAVFCISKLTSHIEPLRWARIWTISFIRARLESCTSKRKKKNQFSLKVSGTDGGKLIAPLGPNRKYQRSLLFKMCMCDTKYFREKANYCNTCYKIKVSLIGNKHKIEIYIGMNLKSAMNTESVAFSGLCLRSAYVWM